MQLSSKQRMGNTFVVVSVCDRERERGREGGGDHHVSCKIIKKRCICI